MPRPHLENVRVEETEPNPSGSEKVVRASFKEKPEAMEASGLRAAECSRAQWRRVWMGDKKGSPSGRWTFPGEGQRQGAQPAGG